MIQLNLPPVVELRVLIDYVSKRMGMNIIYDEAIGAARVTVLAPAKIRKDELVDLLRTVLKMSNLELVDLPQPGWKMVGRKAFVQFVAVKNIGAADLAKRVIAVLEQKEAISGAANRIAPRIAGAKAAAAMAASSTDVTLVPDTKASQIAVIATEGAMIEALALIERLDVPLALQTQIFRFHHINPERIDKMMRNWANAESPDSGAYTATVDEASGMLMVTARESVLKRVELLAKELDVEADPSRSNIQFYKLVNTTAADVLATIKSLQGGSAPAPKNEHPNPMNPSQTGYFTGPNTPQTPGFSGDYLPTPPSYSEGPTSRPVEGGTSSVVSALGQNAVVTADHNTNSIIVVAAPDVQRVYRQLISDLDKRRPQVLVEVTLVTLDTTHNFSLGVELSKTKITSEHSLIVFNSFGLSVIDPKTGLPTLNPGTGFNGILVDPDVLNVVVQAFASDARARVLSAPRILMNDNATGTLASVNEQPFSSVNASATIATTSFAGYATAGTTVTLTPHISEGDYLQLKYTVTLNSFTGQESSGSSLPPPRQTDTIGSEVTVPNGHAVIVGGLTRKDFSNTVSKTPLVGDIPIIKYLFSATNQMESKSTLFVFIRPIILRDDKFEDLKYLSERDLAAAKLPPNYPSSEPIMMQ